MGEYTIKDAAGVTKYFKAAGAGTTGNGFETQVDTGATDDAAAAGAIFPLAGLYQTTVDEVDAGDVGRLRMSARRGLVAVPDTRVLALTTATPVPSGSDIVGFSGVALTSADFTIRDTSTHYIIIPLALGGWSNVIANVSSSLDQAVTVQVNSGFATSLIKLGVLAEFTLPAGVGVQIASSGAVGIGGVAGAATASNRAHYSIPAMQFAPYVWVRCTASVAPTSGVVTIDIMRSA